MDDKFPKKCAKKKVSSLIYHQKLPAWKIRNNKNKNNNKS
jgi:hypothetical protein